MRARNPSWLSATLLLIAALIWSGGMASAAEPGARRLITTPNSDYPGFDYKTVKEVSLEDCSAQCLADGKCQALTYNTKAKWCFLKSGVGTLTQAANATAAKVFVTPPMPDIEAAPALPFVAPETLASAEAYAKLLRETPPSAYADPVLLKANLDRSVTAKDYRGSVNLAIQLVAFQPYDAGLWRNLSGYLADAAVVDSIRRGQLNADSISAALTAYQIAPSREERAEALGLLAQGYERTEDYRKTLEAYKAALAQAPLAYLEAAYDTALSKYGFRVVDYTVDADSSSPRICLQFSDAIGPTSASYDSFVLLNDKPAEGVSVSEKQLCVDGAKHGLRYAVTVRSGLPSIYSEILEKPVTISAYVRDRQPSLRFTGRNFVLPRTGRLAIPVVSVNVDEAELDLYRIDARGLGPIVRGRDFLSQLSGYDADNLAEDRGEKIWSGSVGVERKLNEEVTTSIALAETLPKTEPGLYVMMARPKGERIENWNAQATQWFIISDLGLTALNGEASLDVFVRSLGSAKPIANSEVQLIARDNRILGTAKSDALGHASFDGGLLRGTGGAAPSFVTVSGDQGDYAFLDLTRTAFDFSDRGVGGRDAPGPVDVFLYTDRGIYRPGETVHLSALARDDQANAIAGLPLTIVVTRPDGVEFQRYVSADAKLGGRNIDIDIPDDSMRGSWRAAAYADPKGASLAEMRFLIDDFLPERIEFDLSSDLEVLPLDAPSEIKLAGRFLYGAPASELGLEGEAVYTPVRMLKAYPGYNFGLIDEQIQPYRAALEDLGTTDAEGKATISLQPGELPETTSLYEAQIAVRMREGGGRAVERRITIPVAPNGPRIGIKPLFDGDGLSEGDTATFDVISIAADGTRNAARGLKWELLKVENDYQWYQTGNGWNYDTVEYTERVADGTVDVGTGDPARVAGKIGWGKYRLEVTSPDATGPASSVDFTAGWYFAKSSSDTPDFLGIALDKERYRPGDIAKVKLTPRFAGTALVMVMGEKLIAMKSIDVGASGAEVEIPVTADWGYGTYVTAALYRPMETQASYLPGRAIGLAYAEKDASDRTLSVAIGSPDLSRPLSPLTVPLTLTGLAQGEEAYVTVAAVDLGILNLTRFQPPEPESWYFGQRKLGYDWRDVYGQLIDGSLGTPGQIRTGGGDEGDGGGLNGTPPAQAPVALFSGIVTVGADGKANVTFDVPQFDGTLRVMAVAWSAKSVGHASKDVIVRDPVVVTASMPRFLAPGDQSRIHLDIANAEGPAGDYELTAATTDGIAIAGLPKKVTLAAGQRLSVLLPLSARSVGVQEVELRLTHPAGLDIKRNLALGVRSGQPPAIERRTVALAPGQTLTVTPDLLADTIPGTGSVTVSITRSGALDIPGIVQALDRYPYGCAEQTTSRALPLLYLDEVAARAGMDADAEIKGRVQEAIFRVLANQSSEGSFGLWGPGGGDLWLDAYVSDFLTRSREQGYDVPGLPFDQALTNLQNVLSYQQNFSNGGYDVAYALYVLARNKKASVGDLRYYAESKLDSFTTPLAKAQIGAALALYGDRDRASRVLNAAFSTLLAQTKEDYARLDYGSRLRDGAALLTLAVESDSGSSFIPALTQMVARDQASRRYTSTQENSWMLLAARALAASAQSPELDVDGKRVSGDYVQRLTAKELATAPVKATNRADHAVDAILSYGGVPLVSKPAGGDGFSIERSYFSLSGEAMPSDGIAQGERIVVVLKIKQVNAWPAKILIADLLPAGFEIDNPALVASADLANFGWLPEISSYAHLEFRDDRFVASFTRDAGDNADITLAYVVRAVTPGTFVLPPAMVEDMYRPYLNARTAAGAIEVVGPRQ